MSASNEVESAVGAAAPAQNLEERAARLRTVIADREQPQRELASIEAAIAAKAKADLTAEAARRFLELRRARGSRAASAAQDDVRLLAAAVEYRTAMERLNERYAKDEMDAAEGAALNEVFQLGEPNPQAAGVPCSRKAVQEAQEIVGPQAQPRESSRVLPQHDPRTAARTYAEIAGTEGAALIARKLHG